MQKLMLCSLWFIGILPSIFAQNNTLKGEITDVETQLQKETTLVVDNIRFTPGIPFLAKLSLTYLL